MPEIDSVQDAYLTPELTSTAYLIGEIGDPDIKLISHIHEMTPRDTLNLEINSVGGDCSSSVYLCNTIKESKGKVTAIVQGDAQSAAAMIALACHNLIIKPYSFLMFHSYSTGVIGKQHEVTAALAAYNDVFNKCQEDICTPFLTKKELTTIINGGDIYISYKDPTLPSRIKRHFK